MSREVTIMDVTLRDGAYLFNHQIPIDLVENVLSCLDEAGVSYVEIGHGISVGAREKGLFGEGPTDLDYAKTGEKTKRRAKIGMICLPSIATSDQLKELKPYLDFIRIATNVTQPHEASQLVKKAKDLGYQVFFQMVRTSRVSPKQAGKMAKFIESLGVDVVYLVDSAGGWSPWQVSDYIEEVLSQVKIPVGIHTHDHLGVSLANTIQAIHSGCQWADASLKGAGRGAGNTQIELLNIHLEKLHIKTGLNSSALQLASHLIEEKLEKRGISYEDYLPASVGIDLYPISLYMKICQSAGIELETLVTELGKRDDMVEITAGDLAQALENCGVDSQKVSKELELNLPSIKETYYGEC